MKNIKFNDLSQKVQDGLIHSMAKNNLSKIDDLKRILSTYNVSCILTELDKDRNKVIIERSEIEKIIKIMTSEQ